MIGLDSRVRVRARARARVRARVRVRVKVTVWDYGLGGYGLGLRLRLGVRFFPGIEGLGSGLEFFGFFPVLRHDQGVQSKGLYVVHLDQSLELLFSVLLLSEG